MSDPANQNPGEGDVKPSDIDMTKFVPKEEYEKSLSGKETELQTLQRALEDAQTQLTDPQYLKYLAGQKAERAIDQREEANPTKTDKQLVDRVNQLEAALAQQTAVLELEATERKYSDFNDFRNDIHALITRGGNNLTFEQAYLIAKSQKTGQTTEKSAPKEEPRGTEKPGKFIPDPSSTTQNFKNADDASLAALREVKERYGITGDTI